MADIKYTLPPPTEDVEQICLFRWANAQQGKYPELALMYHVPNGGKRSKSEAARFRAMGVKAGVPDIFLPVKRSGHWLTIPSDLIAPYNGLYIELKRQRGGTVSAAQKQWMQSYGNMVRIKHAPYKKQTLQTRYAHLSSYCVKVGQKVKEGEIIGYSGTTGNVYGAHLHFEVILNGKRTNPLTWLDADYTLATGKEYQFNKGEHSVVVPAADTTTDTADKKLQIPTIGPMSKGDYDALLKTAADNGSAPTLYTVTMQAMSTAAASVLQQKADALGVHYTSKWVED